MTKAAQRMNLYAAINLINQIFNIATKSFCKADNDVHLSFVDIVLLLLIKLNHSEQTPDASLNCC